MTARTGSRTPTPPTPEQPNDPATPSTAARSTPEPARAAAPAREVRSVRSRLAGSAHANRRAAAELRRSAELLPEWAERFETFAVQLDEMADAVEAARPQRKPRKKRTRTTTTTALPPEELARRRALLARLSPELAAHVLAAMPPASRAQLR